MNFGNDEYLTPSKSVMKSLMIEAMALEENRFKNGDVNWDFVDADVYLKVFSDTFIDRRDNETFYQYFDELCFELRNQKVEIV